MVLNVIYLFIKSSDYNLIKFICIQSTVLKKLLEKPKTIVK